MLIVLDNSARAMTSFQPHPGTRGVTTIDAPGQVVDVEAFCRALEIDVQVWWTLL